MWGRTLLRGPISPRCDYSLISKLIVPSVNIYASVLMPSPTPQIDPLPAKIEPICSQGLDFVHRPGVCFVYSFVRKDVHMRKKSVHGPRPRYADKCKLILAAIRSLVYYQQEYHYEKKHGFTMAQIAERCGYARSQRFMETLYSMADDGMIEKIECSGNGLADKTYVFRLPSSVKQTSFAS